MLISEKNKCKLETRLKPGDKLDLEDLKTLHLMALLHNI